MERPRHLAFLAMLLLGVLAGAAGTASASYPSSEPPAGTGGEEAAPAPQPSAMPPPAAPLRSPGRRLAPACDYYRLSARVCDGCPADDIAVPTAACCGPLLAAGRCGVEDCFCPMMETEEFLTTGTLSAVGAVDIYYQCGGRHNVTSCLWQ